MDRETSVFVAGHTGLIGSALTGKLRQKAGVRLILRTRGQLDLAAGKDVDEFFRKERPDYVFMCAGKTGGISANTKYPADFIYENASIALNVIRSAYISGVRKLLYLGCSCMYPRECSQPIKEDSMLTGRVESTSEPYAVAKILGIELCLAFNRQHGAAFIPAVAGNVYGPGGSHFDESAHVIPALIKRFLEAKAVGRDKVVVWGTGKPERDFLYVDDLADACILLMEKADGKEIINIGTGVSVSVARVAETIKKATGFKGRIEYDTGRPDGMPVRMLDTGRIGKAGWKPRTSIDEGIKKTCSWIAKILEINMSI